MLVHLVGFIIRIYHDARSPERQIYVPPWWWSCRSRNTLEAHKWQM